MKTGLSQPDLPRKDGRPQPNRAYLRDPLQLGVSIVGTTAAFGGAGWWLDTKLHTFPILLAFGAAVGLFGIMYTTYKRLRAEENESERHSDHDSPVIK